MATDSSSARGSGDRRSGRRARLRAYCFGPSDAPTRTAGLTERGVGTVRSSVYRSESDGPYPSSASVLLPRCPQPARPRDPDPSGPYEVRPRQPGQGRPRLADPGVGSLVSRLEPPSYFRGTSCVGAFVVAGRRVPNGPGRLRPPACAPDQRTPAFHHPGDPTPSDGGLRVRTPPGPRSEHRSERSLRALPLIPGMPREAAIRGVGAAHEGPRRDQAAEENDEVAEDRHE